MPIKYLFYLAILIVAVVPLLPSKKVQHLADTSVEWPEYFEGIKLSEMELNSSELEWAKSFPGSVKKFSLANAQVLFRHVNHPTRSLHSARDCFRAAGFTISPLPIRIDQDRNRWGCFRAQRSDQDLVSCERIFGIDGINYTDVSAWYWNAMLDKSAGPWWAITLIEVQN